MAVALAALVAAGWCDGHDAVLGAVMAPAMVAGLLVAGRYRGLFDQRYRGLMLMASGFAGLVLLGRALWG